MPPPIPAIVRTLHVPVRTPFPEYVRALGVPRGERPSSKPHLLARADIWYTRHASPAALQAPSPKCALPPPHKPGHSDSVPEPSHEDSDPALPLSLLLSSLLLLLLLFFFFFVFFFCGPLPLPLECFSRLCVASPTAPLHDFSHISHCSCSSTGAVSAPSKSSSSETLSAWAKIACACSHQSYSSIVWSCFPADCCNLRSSKIAQRAFQMPPLPD